MSGAWSPGLWAAGASVSPARLSAEPGAVGLPTRAGLPGGAVAWTPQEPASSFLEPPGRMLAVALSVSRAGRGGGLSPSVPPQHLSETLLMLSTPFYS